MTVWVYNMNVNHIYLFIFMHIFNDMYAYIYMFCKTFKNFLCVWYTTAASVSTPATKNRFRDVS